MPVITFVSVLAGTTLLTAALAVAYARRPTRVPVGNNETVRFEPEPVGPDDGTVEILGLASAESPAVRTDGEAILDAGGKWPAPGDLDVELEDLESATDRSRTRIS